MNTQEMHIEIDLLLQKVNSQSTKNIIPQEKDWFLNREVINYLQSKLNPTSNIKQIGFEDTAKRVEDLKDLIRVSNRPVEVNSRGKSFITFPSDYFSYIRFDVLSYKNCTEISINPTPTAYYKATFVVDPPDTLTGYTITLVTSGGPTVVFDMATLPAGYITNTDFKKQAFLLTKAIKIELEDTLKEELSPDTELYWEKRGYDYNSNTFTLISDTPFISVDVVTNAGTPVVNTASTFNHDIYALSDLPFKSKSRVIDDEFLSEIEASHLSKSRLQSITSVVRESTLELSDTSSAIFGSVDIVYICKPNIIDLLLNSSLNVSEKVAKQVVGNTCRVLKGLIESGDYQAYAQENILTE